MIKELSSSLCLGLTLFLLAAPADSILLLKDLAPGEPTATISGNVTNAAGERLAGAIAVLQSNGPSSQQPVVSAVREPGSLLLLGSGLICLAIMARRHNSRRQGGRPGAETEPNTV